MTAPRRLVDGREEQKCPQCWSWKPFPAEFIGRRGVPIEHCSACTVKYGRWNQKTPEEKAAIGRRGVPVGQGEIRVSLALHSGNRKLGGIPASMTSRASCPPSCGFYDQGCYAQYHVMGHHWRNVDVKGTGWRTFLARVRAMPAGQLWRHNTAGDLPGRGEDLDHAELGDLVEANRGRRGFTHKTGEDNFEMLEWANANGFTVNLSADSLEQADALAAAGAGPVAVVVPAGSPARQRTPAGRRVVVCPAETVNLTCADCQLCAKPWRKAIVAFRAHGQSKAFVSDLVQLRRKDRAA